MTDYLAIWPNDGSECILWDCTLDEDILMYEAYTVLNYPNDSSDLNIDDGEYTFTFYSPSKRNERSGKIPIVGLAYYYKINN